MKRLVAIDIGGTKVRVAVLDGRFRVHASETIPSPSRLEQFQPALIELINHLLDNQPPDAIGIAAPGAVDRHTGTIGPFSNVTWPKFAIRNWLTHHYHCPVVVEHDATSGGICEAHLGAGQGYRYQLYVTISTGIGTALILDGKPLPGPHNAEGGHMLIREPGKHTRAASFEYLASGRAIVREYGKIAADINSAKDWQRIAAQFAVGLHNFIVITDPEIVILGGGVSVHYKKFIKPLTAELKKLSTVPGYPLPPIHQAKYVETAPLLGAAFLASGAAAS